jgi:hypothetical protein
VSSKAVLLPGTSRPPSRDEGGADRKVPGRLAADADALTVPIERRPARDEMGVAREAEVARLVAIGVHPDVARTLHSCEESHPSVDKTDVDVDVVALLENLGRGRERRGPAIPVRPTSDGSDFVRYSAEALPAAPHRELREPQSVVLARELRGAASRESPTVLVPRRIGRPSRLARAGAIGLVAGIALAATVHAARDRSSADPHRATSEPPADVESPAEPTITASEKRTAAPALAGASSRDGVPSPASAAPPASLAPSVSKVVERPKPFAAGHGEADMRRGPTPKTAVPMREPTPESLARRPSEAKQHYLLELP